MKEKYISYIGKCLHINNSILVVGDLHLGYEESLNNSGVFVSRAMFDEIIVDFDKVFDRLGEEGKNVEKVVLLGDVKHAFGENLRQEWNDVLALFDYFLEKRKVGEIIVTRGNHDNYLKTIAGKRSVRVEDYYIVDEYCFVHGDKEYGEMDGKGIKYWIMGHGHPAVRIGDGTKTEKYKCFLTGKYKSREVIVVPSFIEYNEGSDPRENDLGFPWDFDLNKFEVRVVGEDLKALSFGRLGKMK